LPHTQAGETSWAQTNNSHGALFVEHYFLAPPGCSSSLQHLLGPRRPTLPFTCCLANGSSPPLWACIRRQYQFLVRIPLRRGSKDFGGAACWVPQQLAFAGNPVRDTRLMRVLSRKGTARRSLGSQLWLTIASPNLWMAISSSTMIMESRLSRFQAMPPQTCPNPTHALQ
jgi:hypothetical protein